MEKKYYFSIDDRQVGPMSAEEIKEKINQGSINAATLAWCEGMSDWEKVSDIEGLKGMVVSSSATPPPLPKKAAVGAPEGLSSFEAVAYKFVLTAFPQWGKRPVKVREYVLKNPKKAVPVAVGTLAAIVVCIALMMSVVSSPEPQVAQGAGQQFPAGQPPAGWQAQHRAWQDAQRYTQDVIDDAYKYNRDAQDRMDEVYRKGTYDFMSDD